MAPNRDERLLMRQRGAGTRQIKHAGFDLVLPGQEDRAPLQPKKSGRSRQTLQPELLPQRTSRRTPKPEELPPKQSSRKTPAAAGQKKRGRPASKRKAEIEDGQALPSSETAQYDVGGHPRKRRKVGKQLADTARKDVSHAAGALGTTFEATDPTKSEKSAEGVKRRKKRRSIGQQSTKRVKAKPEKPPAMENASFVASARLRKPRVAHTPGPPRDLDGTDRRPPDDIGRYDDEEQETPQERPGAAEIQARKGTKAASQEPQKQSRKRKQALMEDQPSKRAKTGLDLPRKRAGRRVVESKTVLAEGSQSFEDTEPIVGLTDPEYVEKGVAPEPTHHGKQAKPKKKKRRSIAQQKPRRNPISPVAVKGPSSTDTKRREAPGTSLINPMVEEEETSHEIFETQTTKKRRSTGRRKTGKNLASPIAVKRTSADGSERSGATGVLNPTAEEHEPIIEPLEPQAVLKRKKRKSIGQQGPRKNQRSPAALDKSSVEDGATNESTGKGANDHPARDQEQILDIRGGRTPTKRRKRRPIGQQKPRKNPPNPARKIPPKETTNIKVDKKPAPEASPTTRKRGRRPKTPASVDPERQVDDGDEDVPEPTVSAPKRKRGRPKKTDTTQASNPAPAPELSKFPSTSVKLSTAPRPPVAPKNSIPIAIYRAALHVPDTANVTPLITTLLPSPNTVNAVDVLAQYTREIIPKLTTSLLSSSTSSTTATINRQVKIIERYGEELDSRFIQLTQVLDRNMALDKRVKEVAKEERAARKKLKELEGERVETGKRKEEAVKAKKMGELEEMLEGIQGVAKKGWETEAETERF